MHDMHADGGPLNAFREFDDKNKKMSRFKKHMKEMVTIANSELGKKESNGIAPLAYEVTGRELYDILQASQLRLTRKIQEDKKRKQENAERIARMRVINARQGLNPHPPVPTQQPAQQQPATQQPIQQQPVIHQPIQQQQPTIQQPIQQQPAIHQTSPVRQLAPATQPRGQVRTPAQANDGMVTVSSGRPSQRRRQHINAPRPSVLHFEDETIPEEFRNNIRVPHNDAPVNRHRDMIDRIDQGNTIANHAMAQLTTVLNNENRNQHMNFTNVVGLIAATSTATNSDDGYKNLVTKAYEVAHEIIEKRNNN